MNTHFPIGTDKFTSKFIGKSAWTGFNDFMNMAFQPGYDERMGTFEKQINEANRALQNLSNTKSVDFDFTVGNDRANAKLLAQVPKVWNEIIDNIDFNENWMVFYNYGDVWRSRKLDEVNREYLKDQISEEYLKDQISEDFKTPLIQGSINLGVVQADYDFFPVSIRELKQVRFVNTGKFNAGTQITSTGQQQEVRVARWEESDVYKKAMEANTDSTILALAKAG